MKERKMIESTRPMRPIGLIGLIGLVGLMGCSQSETVEPTSGEGVAIAFSTNMPEQQAVVRSTPLEDYCQSFRVWSYKNMEMTGDSYGTYQTVMDNYTVNWEANTAGTSISNSHDWEYVNGTTQHVHFWDFSAKAYRFFAVAPASATGTFALSTGGESFTAKLTVDASSEATVNASPYISQLWFSNNNIIDYPDKPYGQQVTLKFIKPMARVRFMFVFNEDLDFGRSDLTEITFHPTDNSQITTKGDVTIAYPLTGTETEMTVSSVATDGIDAFETDEQWYYVLPAPSQGTYTLNLKVLSEPKTAVVPASYMTWEAGKEYTYVFRITDADRVVIDAVQVGVKDWNDAGDKDRTIYNW